MIQKRYRFTSWDGFIKIVLKKGPSFRSDFLSLRTLPSNHSHLSSRYTKLISAHPKLNKGMSPAPKFAVVVSKKVSKSAVTRNRIRRRIYEWLRLNLSQLDQEQLTVIFVHNEILAKMPYLSLVEQLEKTFKKAGLFKDVP